MKASGLILLIPNKPDAERDALADAWEQHDGQVLRLGRFWDPPKLDAKHVRVYGSTSFVLVLQKKLGFDLCTPPDDLILSLPSECLKRWIQKQSLQEAEHFPYPLFVKPIIPKLFGARVYANAAAAEFACSPVLPRTLVLDIGLIKDQGWAVVEINAAWGSGLNGCRAERVWPCIVAASGPQSDKPFAR